MIWALANSYDGVIAFSTSSMALIQKAYHLGAPKGTWFKSGNEVKLDSDRDWKIYQLANTVVYETPGGISEVIPENRMIRR